MTAARRPMVTPQFVIGLVALTMGVLLLAGNLGYAPAYGLLSYWPAALVVIGLAKLIQAQSLGGAIGGSLWMAAGAWLLATNLNLVRLTFSEAVHTYWPLLLVGAGLSIVLRTVRRGTAPKLGVDPRNELHVIAILGGNKRASGSQSFRGGELTAILGGIELDLTRAHIANGDAVLDVFTLWGGLELRVPEGWVVDNQMVVFMGGYEDRSRPVGDPQAPRLVLRGTTTMGGVEVRN